MAEYDKLVLVTRQTRLEGLIARFNTQAQAKFYIEHAGGDFSAYVEEHDAYRRAFDAVRRALDIGLKIQVMDRSLVPTTLFGPADVILTLGQDGLVANTAKYVGGQPILGVNPDPARFDGVLLPFLPADVPSQLQRVLRGQAAIRQVTLAEAQLADGQRLLAFNELFIGAQSHVSARYRIRFGSTSEDHSSSGILVSTGAGSTGWLSSVCHQTAGIAAFLGAATIPSIRMAWDEDRLTFVVREPFLSRHSQVGLVAGHVEPQVPLYLESQMPSGGVIFSDGIESDRLEFNAGAMAMVGIAQQRANLVTYDDQILRNR